jgi:BlaI family penicillinase repressor
MQKKLFEGEMKLMELLWETEPTSAKALSLLAADRIGWNKNTTYTVLKKLIEKEAVKREEPGFVCTSLVGRDTVRRRETARLIDRLYGGSKQALFSSLLADEALSKEELSELRALLDEQEPEC